MELSKTLCLLVDQTLNLGGRGLRLTRESPLAGAIPELDSMGVVALIGALEEAFDIEIADTEIDGAVFQSFGTLEDFVTRKLSD